MSLISTQVPLNLLDPRVESLPPPPPPEKDFRNRLDGVVIPVWAGDVYLAKACCASVRQSMGDIPITLLVDGPATDTRELERLPFVRRMVVQEVAGEEEVRLCAGTPWTKMLLFWLSPYERFLCLDADILVWGDLRAYAEFDQYDFIVTHRFNDVVRFERSEQLLGCVSDVAVFKKLDPALDWHGQEEDNTGVFFARRGIYAKENLMALRRLDGWTCFESGVFRYLHWRALREKVPRTIGRKLQLFPADQTSSPGDRFLPRDCRRPAIIHWITKKPKLGRRYRAFDDYRKLFLKMTGRSKWLEARLFFEDVGVWLRRQRRSLTRRWQRIQKTKP
jgi:hypothetical protein